MSVTTDHVVPPRVRRIFAVTKRVSAAAQQERAFLAGLAASLEQTQREAAAVAAASLAARRAQVAADKAAAELSVEAPDLEEQRRHAVRTLNNVWGEGYRAFVATLSREEQEALARPVPSQPLTLAQVRAYKAALPGIYQTSAAAHC